MARFHVRLGPGDPETERALAEANRTVFEQHLITGELQPPDTSIRQKLRLMVTGPSVSVPGRHDPARDAQAELFAGVLFYGAGFRVDSAEPDLVLSRAGERFGVAVKRVTSSKNFDKRLRQARNQLLSAGKRGFIVVSADQYLSEVYFRDRSANLSAVHYARISEWTDRLPLDPARNPVLAVSGISTSFRHRSGGSGQDLEFQIHFHNRFVTWQEPAAIAGAQRFGESMAQTLRDALLRLNATP